VSAKDHPDHPMTIVCAWCRDVLSEGDPERESHTICRECFLAVRAGFLDRLDAGWRARQSGEESTYFRLAADMARTAFRRTT